MLCPTLHAISRQAMRKTILLQGRLLLLATLWSVTSSTLAQNSMPTERGVEAVNSTSAEQPAINKRYALIIGISDYATEDLNLQYAANDAELVYRFFRSPAGGELPLEHIRLLRNQEATAARIVSELRWLSEKAESRDEIIIYFAGHGDLEDITAKENGRAFLLAYDAPASRGYWGAAGALSMDLLRPYINHRLSVGNHVMLILDACRSGHGSQSITAASHASTAISNGFKKIRSDIEQKHEEVNPDVHPDVHPEQLSYLLSSRANESSYEDPALGHGLFTYYLIEGLTGKAAGLDGEVTLEEARRYARDSVKKHAKTLNVIQHPLISDHVSERPLGRGGIDFKNLDTIPLPPLQLGYEIFASDAERARFVASLSDTTQALIERFRQALNDGRLVIPDENSAEFYFNQFYTNIDIRQQESLFARLRDEFVVALTDRANAVTQNNISLALLEQPLDSRTHDTNAGDHIGAEANDSASDRTDSSMLDLPILEIQEAARALELALDLQGSTLQGIDLRPLQHLLTGLTYALTRQHQQTIDILEPLTRSSPSPFVSFVLGRAYMQVGRADAAMDQFKYAAQRQPDWVEPVRMMGITMQRNERYQDALAYYQHALTINPNDATLLVDAGEVLHLTGRPDAANTYWQQALTHDADYATKAIANYYHDRSPGDEQAQRDTALAFYTQQLDQRPTPKLHVDLGDFHLDHGHYDDAMEHYRAAMTIDPSFARAYNGLGLAYEFQRRYPEAAQQYQEALALKGDNAQILRNLGDVARAVGDFDQALAYYERGLAADPTDTVLLLSQALVLLNAPRADEASKSTGQLGRLRSMASLLERALAIDPGSVELNHILGKLYLYIGRYTAQEATFARATRYLERARELALEQHELTNAAEVSADLGDAHRYLGQRLKAAFAYQSAHYFSDQDSDSRRHGHQGNTLLYQGQVGPRFALQPVGALAFAPDDRTLAIVQPQTPNEVMMLPLTPAFSQATASFHILRDHSDWVRSVAFSPDGRTLVTGSDDSTVVLYTLQGNQAPGLRARLETHSDWVRSVTLTESILATGADDGLVQFYDAATEQKLRSFEQHGHVHMLALSSDGQYLATGSDDDLVRIWDTERAETTSTYQLSRFDEAVHSLAFSPREPLLIAGSQGGFVYTWNARSQSEDINRLSPAHDAEIRSVAFSSDGRYFASASEDGQVIVWNAFTLRAVWTLDKIRAPIRGVAFARGEAVLAVHEGLSVSFWDVEAQQHLAVIDLTDLSSVP